MRITPAWIGMALLLTCCTNRITNIIVQPPMPTTTAEQTPVPPAKTGPDLRGAESGQKSRMAMFLGANPDCSSTGYPNVKITTQPQFGQLSIERGEDFPSFKKENPRSECNTQRLPSIRVFYTSNPGYTGTDRFELQTLYPAGRLVENSYQVTVR